MLEMRDVLPMTIEEEGPLKGVLDVDVGVGVGVVDVDVVGVGVGVVRVDGADVVAVVVAAVAAVVGVVVVVDAVDVVVDEVALADVDVDVATDAAESHYSSLSPNSTVEMSEKTSPLERSQNSQQLFSTLAPIQSMLHQIF